MWLPSGGHKMPAADMAAAPLLPRPAEELKMAASRKCGAERNARQRGKRRPSGNAARPAPPGPGLLPRQAPAPPSSSWRYIILLPCSGTLPPVSRNTILWPRARWRNAPLVTLGSRPFCTLPCRRVPLGSREGRPAANCCRSDLPDPWPFMGLPSWCLGLGSDVWGSGVSVFSRPLCVMGTPGGRVRNLPKAK